MFLARAQTSASHKKSEALQETDNLRLDIYKFLNPAPTDKRYKHYSLAENAAISKLADYLATLAASVTANNGLYPLNYQEQLFTVYQTVQQLSPNLGRGLGWFDKGRRLAKKFINLAGGNKAYQRWLVTQTVSKAEIITNKTSTATTLPQQTQATQHLTETRNETWHEHVTRAKSTLELFEGMRNSDTNNLMTRSANRVTDYATYSTKIH